MVVRDVSRLSPAVVLSINTFDDWVETSIIASWMWR